jgi:hypothetical protein
VPRWVILVAMASPFPGMDPYLERHWRDVHLSLIAEARRHLNQTLPSDLVARSDERVYVESDDASVREVFPDLRVVERPLTSPAAAVADAGAAAVVARPILLSLESEPVRERFIEIREIEGGKLITAVEFISPTNKASGEGRDAYLKKRGEFLDSDSNLVEIDLTRGGDWVRLMRPYRVPPEYRTPYRASVRRARRPEKGELFPITLRERLPTIPVPLRDIDPDASLELQTMVQRVYVDGRYNTLDYRRPCAPPLEDEDAAWADELLRAAGRR